MMDPQLGSLIPIRTILPSKPLKYEQQVIVNWLQLEVDPEAPARMPVLHDLKGWRNREVFCYVRYEMPDWTIGACH